MIIVQCLKSPRAAVRCPATCCRSVGMTGVGLQVDTQNACGTADATTAMHQSLLPSSGSQSLPVRSEGAIDGHPNAAQPVPKRSHFSPNPNDVISKAATKVSFTALATPPRTQTVLVVIESGCNIRCREVEILSVKNCVRGETAVSHSVEILAQWREASAHARHAVRSAYRGIYGHAHDVMRSRCRVSGVYQAQASASVAMHRSAVYMLYPLTRVSTPLAFPLA